MMMMDAAVRAFLNDLASRSTVEELGDRDEIEEDHDALDAIILRARALIGLENLEVSHG